MVGKASKGVVAGYSSAATVAQEVFSSVRTAQAFGSEEKLASLYDENLKSAQKAGYRKAVAMALLLASLFGSRYLLFGLAFCTSMSYAPNI
jgi:ATP-binding cassette, subfamily B (MDR/TAP), member 1